jgi:WD40 repeat protein
MRSKFWIALIVLLVTVGYLIISAGDSVAQTFPDSPTATLGKGHVGAVKFSPDGRYLAIATSLGIQLVSTKNWSNVAMLEGRRPFDFHISDGRLILASYSDEGKVNLLDVDANLPLGTLNVDEGMIGRITFSNDGKLLAVGGEELKLWDVAKRRVSAVLDAKWAWGIDFSPDDKLLAVGLWHGNLQLWDLEKGKIIAELDKSEKQIRDVAFSPDGRFLAAGAWDSSVKIWDVGQLRKIVTLRKPTKACVCMFVQDLDFSPDGKLLAAVLFGGMVQIWDTRGWKEVSTFKGPSSTYSLSFSPDGELLALGGWREVQIRDIRDNNLLVHSISDYNSGYWALSFSPDGRLIAAGPTVWETKSLKPIHSFDEDSRIEALAFSPNGRLLACGRGWGHPLELWNTSTWRKAITKELGSNMWVHSLAFSPDGRLLAAGLKSLVKIFDVPNMREIKTLNGHLGSVNSVAFSPDGRLLAASSYLKVKIWDVETYKLKYEFQGHSSDVTSVIFSPDGRLLASASKDGIIKLWDMGTGKLIRTMEKGLTWVMCLSFSPNGRYLAAGSIRVRPRRLVEKTVQIWDVTNGELVWELKGLKGYIRVISFSPDGRLLALGSQAGVLSLWEMPSPVWMPKVVEPEGKEMAFWGEVKHSALYQNYPNPFNSETWIPFALAKGSYVLMEIYDAAGKLVRRLDLGYRREDDYSDKLKAAYWDGRDDKGEEMSSGLYFYTIKAGDFIATRKMVITR